MKKGILCGVITIILPIFLCSCGNNDTSNNVSEQGDTIQETTEEVKEEIIEEENLLLYKLGETVETDILRITLNTAKLTIAVENTYGSDYFLPKEYDIQDDANNPFVAAKGHSLVAITYTAENLDRTSINFDGNFNNEFMSVQYNGEAYSSETVYGYKSANGWDWKKYNSSNVLLQAAETEVFRCYIDIPIEIDNLLDDFSLTFYLPKSDGTIERFTYVVTNEDRETISKQEISLDEAINTFTNKKSQEYFKNHIDDFRNITGDEINEIISSKTWNIIIKEQYGSWEGKFEFEDNGRIKETLEKYGTDYFNDRTWSINENILIIATPKKSIECEVKEVCDGIFLLISNENPYLLMK